MRMNAIARNVFAVGLLCSPLIANAATPPEDLADYQRQVRPILAAVCFGCHGADEQQGDVRLDTFSADVHSDDFDAEAWHDALDQLKRGDMPPPKVKKSAAKVKQPATRELVDAERQLLVTWISATLQAAEQVKRASEGRVLMRRLTRYEYANTMRDLLGIDFDFARDLPPEPASPDGFLNDGATLEMSSTQIEAYLSAARQALQVAIVSGDQPEVHRYHATETAVGKLPRKKEGGHLPVNPEFLLDIPKFPRRGTFRLTIRAAAVIPPGEDYPRLQVSLGNVPGIIHVPRKRLGEVDVTAPIDAPQSFVFEGRLEDFPQPGDREFGANVDFDGMIALIDFVDADGNELRYGDRSYSDPPPKPNAKGKQKSPPRTGRAVPENGPRYDIVVESVEFEAPYFKSWPPSSHQRLLAHSPAAKSETQRLREILVQFMPRAFRRPVADHELSQTMELFASIRPKLDSFEAAVGETLASVLVSPHFLYIVDRQLSSEEGGDAARLTEFELATRLSYFLWSTMPDPTLQELAAAGTLSRPEVLRRQLQRMLDDPQALELVNHFSDQWFGLDTLDRVAVNPEFYPQFDNELKAAMRAETRGFVREILARNASCLELIQSDWTIANRSLAKHYGLATVPRSSQFVRVHLQPEDHRGGILGHGAFLLSQSDGERPHPIRRAVWILDRLLDSPPASPPPDVPELDAEAPDLVGLTLKQQLEVHRRKESCRTCHEGIDPWGIPLEHFDAVGVWRERSPVRVVGAAKAKDKPPLADATAVLPDGRQVSGAKELKSYLAEEGRELFARAVVKRLASYALGRSLDWGDRESVDTLTADFVENDLRLRHLIISLVQSELFQTK